jgi:hypothetical protein
MAGANIPIALKSDNLSSGASAGCRLIPDGKDRMLRLTAAGRSKLAPSVARPNLFSGD